MKKSFYEKNVITFGTLGCLSLFIFAGACLGIMFGVAVFIYRLIVG